MTKEGNQKFPGPVYWKLPGPVKKPSSPLRYKLLIISRCNTIFFHGFQVLYFYGSIQCAKACGKMTAFSTYPIQWLLNSANLWIDPVRMQTRHVESAYSISHRNRNLD